ncbi:malignant fibrous histiocytoma-amplified sequence 1 isoform X2 [Brienomyrus brachyistius]|uniref:malignant fibrous histiocytoma-amplified sequence 1 isoform X2 n=1 Tax=Brienomyrus brachyistius TaxID=42636 RepID=UPI0020B45EF8|nr:malignant fibrous histiocytoma-amplified sequence 1 isoform X2 [Brienomyrus brachyistius]
MARSNDVHDRRGLDFSKQRLNALPQEIFGQAEYIESLNLQINELQHIGHISQLINLKELILSWNNISEFPAAIRELKNLQRLYLNQNKIQKIPTKVFSFLVNLQYLNLSNNHLEELPADLVDCKSLKYVNLSNNYLKNLWAVVGLPLLNELHVENNRLTELPAELFLRTDLKVFRVNGNQLKTPPEEVCAGGVKDIQSYFRQLEADLGGDTVARVKTLFLGSSMAGKSTLCRSLREGRAVTVEASDRTVGIDISEVEKDGVQFLFWDFAGHEEYYLTHHIFITPHALVILAIDLSSYDIEDAQSFEDKVSFWIKNVLMRVPDSVLLLVGTHADQCEDAEQRRKKKEDIEKKTHDLLEERTSNLDQQISHIIDKSQHDEFSEHLTQLHQLKGYTLKVSSLITIDCTKCADIEEIQKHILQHVQNKRLFPNIVRTLPHSYKEVESSMRCLIKKPDFPKHGIVDLHNLVANSALNSGNLSKEDLHSILRYLHRTGTILWFEEIEDLKETVFVKPSFLITLFKTLVRHDLVKQLMEVPSSILKKENCPNRHRNKWIDRLKSQATLSYDAVRVLVRRALMQADMARDEHFVKEMTGTRNKEGKILSLLRYFEICLPTNFARVLNPQASEFEPNKKWGSSLTQRHSFSEPEPACMFPGYLKDNDKVMKMWGQDDPEDIKVLVYFMPEIPHGVFHRLIVRLCSMYSTHWVGNSCLLAGYEAVLVLVKKSTDIDDQYIEIRCKRPEHNLLAFKQLWNLILAVLSELNKLSSQWPGLYQYTYSPCREPGCTDEFKWKDWHSLPQREKVQEEKMTCLNGHTCKTYLLFPKDPIFPTSNHENPDYLYANISMGPMK